MARVTEVQKAKKDQGPCRACGLEIVAGESYKWLKKRYGSKKVCHPGCSFRPSDQTGGRLGEVYDAQEDASNTVSNWSGSDVDELRSHLEDFGNRLEELSDEYQESCDNIREHFESSDKADECEEKASGLTEWKDELEAADLDEWEAEEPDDKLDCEECEGDQTLKYDTTDDDGEAIYHCEGKDTDGKDCGHTHTVDAKNVSDETMEEWGNAQRDKAQEVVDNCPL